MLQGFIWPAAFVLTNNWSTKTEVNKLAGFVATGLLLELIFFTVEIMFVVSLNILTVK